MDDHSKKLLTNVLTILFALVGFIAGSKFLIETDDNQPEFTIQPSVEPSVDPGKIDEVKKKQEAELARYTASKKIDVYPNGLVTPRSLIKACEDGAKNQQACNEEIAKITQVIKTSGDISKAYLYARLATGKSDGLKLIPLTQYDSLWFYITNNKSTSIVSGHLLRSKAIIYRSIVDDSGQGYTELLFDLKELPFTKLPYNEASDPVRTGDALEALNTDGSHFTGGFVSSLNYGKILELRIGYEDGQIVN